MGYRLNRLDEPVFIEVSKPLLTEFGIHHRLESCDIYHLIEHRKVMEAALFDFISRLISPLPNYILWHCIFRPRTFSISLDRFEGKAIHAMVNPSETYYVFTSIFILKKQFSQKWMASTTLPDPIYVLPYQNAFITY